MRALRAALEKSSPCILPARYVAFRIEVSLNLVLGKLHGLHYGCGVGVCGAIGTRNV